MESAIQQVDRQALGNTEYNEFHGSLEDGHNNISLLNTGMLGSCIQQTKIQIDNAR